MQYVKVNTPNGAVVTKNNFGAWSVSNHDALDVSTYGVYGLDTETKQWITNGEDSVVRVPTETTVTASGVAKLNNCAEEPLQGLRVFGRTTQDGTPTPDAPVELVNIGDDGAVDVIVAGKNLIPRFNGDMTGAGLSALANNDGSITLNGTVTERVVLQILRPNVGWEILKGTYTVSTGVVLPTGVQFTTEWYLNGKWQSTLGVVRPGNCEATFFANKLGVLAAYISINVGVALDNFTIYPQLEVGSSATSYEPYQPAQIFTLSTPNGLPSVGDVCDEIDLERGVYVQRIGRITSYAGESVGGSWASTTGTLDAGAEVLYVLAAPVETPLSAEEVAAYNTLRTHYPTTTAYNDNGAQMEITYREDLDGVLENTFAALNLTDRHIPLLVYGESAQDHIIDTNDTGLVNTLLNALQGITAIGNRMIGYYPEVIKAILEFTAITRTEGYEIECLNNDVWGVLDDAYLLTMGEERIEQWERILGIVVQENSTVQDRRDVVVARIRGQGKLNTALINAIVNAFTGGTAVSWVEDSVLNVEITPPPNNKQFKFENVEHELSKKVPAHIGLKVMRSYAEWIDIKNNFATWNDVKSDLGTWTDVMFFVVRS